MIKSFLKILNKLREKVQYLYLKKIYGDHNSSLKVKIAINKILKLMPEDGVGLNIGSGKSISVKKLTTMILSISGVKNKRIKYDNSKPSVKTSVSLDCSKAKSLLGWSQKVSIEEGIKKTISWYKEINNITTSNSK